MQLDYFFYEIYVFIMFLLLGDYVTTCSKLLLAIINYVVF